TEAHSDGPVARPTWEPMFQSLMKARRATRMHDGDREYWVAAEQLPLARAIHAHAQVAPLLDVPADYAARTLPRHDAIREQLRGRLQAVGPVTASQLASSLGIAGPDIESALLALETEGFVM